MLMQITMYVILYVIDGDGFIKTSFALTVFVDQTPKKLYHREA